MELEGHNLTTAMQAALFLHSILLGLPAGLLLDCFRTLRALLPHPAPLVFLEDALYVFLCIFGLQCFIWMEAGGAFRWQYAAGACIGLSIYLMTFGAVWMRLLNRLRRAVRRGYALIGRALMRPLRGICRKNLKKYLTECRIWVYNKRKHQKMQGTIEQRNGAQHGTKHRNGEKARKRTQTRDF